MTWLPRRSDARVPGLVAAFLGAVIACGKVTRDPVDCEACAGASEPPDDAVPQAGRGGAVSAGASGVGPGLAGSAGGGRIGSAGSAGNGGSGTAGGGISSGGAGEAGDTGSAGAPPIEEVVIDLTLHAVGASAAPDMSNDGRFVVFRTLAGNLTSDAPDGGVFVVDVATAQFTRVSTRDPVDLNPMVPERPRISGDGRFAFFRSNRAWSTEDRDSVEDLYRVERGREGTRLVSVADPSEGRFGFADFEVSDDGAVIVFHELPTIGDMEARRCFVDDLRVPAIASRVAPVVTDNTYGGSLWRPAISGDGRRVAFDARALVLTTNGELQVFVEDLARKVIELVSVNSQGIPGDGMSFAPALSRDGSVIAFQSDATNLVERDENATRDIFVHELTTGRTERVSVASSGAEANGHSSQPTLSADGRYVAFLSMASNLASRDDNDRLDVFVHDRRTRVTRRVSVTAAGDGGAGSSCIPSSVLSCGTPALSADGAIVVFESDAGDLVPGSTAGQRDVYWVNWQRLSIPPQ